MLCKNFKAQYSHFSDHRKPNVPTSSQNEHKQMMSISSTQQRFFLLFPLAAAKSSLTDLMAKSIKRLLRLDQRLRT